MLTAKQVRTLKESMQHQEVEAELYKIFQSIVERAIDPKGTYRVDYDVDYTDERVDFIANRLHGMGYAVTVNKYPEDRYSSLTISF